MAEYIFNIKYTRVEVSLGVEVFGRGHERSDIFFLAQLALYRVSYRYLWVAVSYNGVAEYCNQGQKTQLDGYGTSNWVTSES